jgi:hypothetical protein
MSSSSLILADRADALDPLDEVFESRDDAVIWLQSPPRSRRSRHAAVVVLRVRT